MVRSGSSIQPNLRVYPGELRYAKRLRTTISWLPTTSATVPPDTGRACSLAGLRVAQALTKERKRCRKSPHELKRSTKCSNIGPSPGSHRNWRPRLSVRIC